MRGVVSDKLSCRGAAALGEVQAMRRVLLLILALGTLALFSSALATQASAAATVPVSMTFNEPGVPSVNSGCPQGISSCGHGQVIPFGQATEMIVFFACGNNPELSLIHI